MAATRMLNRHNPEVCRKYLNRVIRGAMAEQEIPCVRDLALRMGVEPESLRRRMRGEAEWKLADLCRLIEALDLTMDDLGVIFGMP